MWRFARFKLLDGVGCPIAYSHRIYGENVGGRMSNWLGKNGPKTEKMFMGWKNIPLPPSLHELPRIESSPSDTKASPSNS
jgi:hypothetical protein